METALNESNWKPQTGNPTKWVSGLYSRDTNEGVEWVAVYNGSAAFWSDKHTPINIVVDGAHFDGMYTKIPDYSGRIASITPEWVGGEG